MIYQRRQRNYGGFKKLFQVSITLFAFVILPAMCFELWLQKEGEYMKAISHESNVTYVDGVAFDKHGRKAR